MPISLIRSDGLHILAKATLQQLTEDKNLLSFAGGLIPNTLAGLLPAKNVNLTLAEALHHHGMPLINALLTTLLVLDAEVSTIIDDETRVWPLTGFLSYRSHLNKYPLNTLRLPPLNNDGHYVFTTIQEEHYLAVRLDLHPKLRITGHVRIAISSPKRPPQRLQATEHRLDRQVLNEEIIAAAVLASDEAFSMSLLEIEQERLIEVLTGLR